MALQNPRRQSSTVLRALAIRTLRRKKTDRTKFEDSKQEYYAEVGWDENGILKSEVLKRLGLTEVDSVLDEKVR